MLRLFGPKPRARTRSHSRRNGLEVQRLEPRELLAAFVVNSLADVAGPAGSLNLRQAVQLSNLTPGPNSITFAPGLSGEIHLTQGQIDIANQNLSIANGGLPNSIAISGNTSRIFETHSVVVTLNNLTLENGVALGTNSTPGAGGDGGAIQQDGGVLNLVNDNFVGNRSTMRGGAVFNFYGQLNVTGGQFSGNSTDRNGGAIYNSGTMTDTGTLFLSNSGGYGGGAIENAASILQIGGVNATVTGSTFVGNSGLFGGAVNNDNGAALTLNTDTFLTNHATQNGGAVYNGVTRGASTAIVNGGTYQANSAALFGGALYTESSMSVTGANLIFNTAVSGGAIWATPGTLTAVGNTVNFNSAPQIVS